MSRRPVRQINTDNVEVRAGDRDLAENPPEITWRLNGHGIWVAASVVETPQARTTVQRPVEPGRRPRCRRGHQYTVENTYISPAGYRQCRACKLDRQQARRSSKAEVTEALRDSMQIEATEVAERFRQHHADNTPLMRSAREI